MIKFLLTSSIIVLQTIQKQTDWTLTPNISLLQEFNLNLLTDISSKGLDSIVPRLSHDSESKQQSLLFYKENLQNSKSNNSQPSENPLQSINFLFDSQQNTISYQSTDISSRPLYWIFHKSDLSFSLSSESLIEIIENKSSIIEGKFFLPRNLTLSFDIHMFSIHTAFKVLPPSLADCEALRKLFAEDSSLHFTITSSSLFQYSPSSLLYLLNFCQLDLLTIFIQPHSSQPKYLPQIIPSDLSSQCTVRQVLGLNHTTHNNTSSYCIEDILLSSTSLDFTYWIDMSFDSSSDDLLYDVNYLIYQDILSLFRALNVLSTSSRVMIALPSLRHLSMNQYPSTPPITYSSLSISALEQFILRLEEIPDLPLYVVGHSKAYVLLFVSHVHEELAVQLIDYYKKHCQESVFCDTYVSYLVIPIFTAEHETISKQIHQLFADCDLIENCNFDTESLELLDMFYRLKPSLRSSFLHLQSIVADIITEYDVVYLLMGLEGFVSMPIPSRTLCSSDLPKQNILLAAEYGQVSSFKLTSWLGLSRMDEGDAIHGIVSIGRVLGDFLCLLFYEEPRYKQSNDQEITSLLYHISLILQEYNRSFVSFDWNENIFELSFMEKYIKESVDRLNDIDTSLFFSSFSSSERNYCRGEHFPLLSTLSFESLKQKKYFPVDLLKTLLRSNSSQDYLTSAETFTSLTTIPLETQIHSYFLSRCPLHSENFVNNEICCISLDDFQSFLANIQMIWIQPRLYISYLLFLIHLHTRVGLNPSCGFYWTNYLNIVNYFQQILHSLRIYSKSLSLIQNNYMQSFISYLLYEFLPHLPSSPPLWLKETQPLLFEYMHKEILAVLPERTLFPQSKEKNGLHYAYIHLLSYLWSELTTSQSNYFLSQQRFYMSITLSLPVLQRRQQLEQTSLSYTSIRSRKKEFEENWNHFSHVSSSVQLHFLTYASNVTKELEILAHSATMANISIEIIGLNQPYISYDAKVLGYYNYLTSTELTKNNQHDVLVLMDAYDVIVFPAIQQIAQIYLQARTPLLFCSESGIYPEFSAPFHYQQGETYSNLKEFSQNKLYFASKFLNSGCIVGNRKYLQKLFRSLIQYNQLYRDDQQMIVRYWLQHPDMISLDKLPTFDSSEQTNVINKFAMTSFKTYSWLKQYCKLLLSGQWHCKVPKSSSSSSHSLLIVKDSSSSNIFLEYNIGLLHSNNKKSNYFYDLMTQELLQQITK